MSRTKSGDTGGAYYGLAAVSRSLWHFVMGKSFAVVSTVSVLFVLATVLDPQAYAAYVAFQALVMLAGRVSGLGLQKVMLRYLPELRGTANNRSAYRLLWIGTLLRAALVATVLLAAWALLPAIGRGFGLTQWLWLVPWYLLVGYLHLMGQWVAAMLESFLWQREAQYPLAIGGVVKLVLVLALLQDLDLATLVAVELFCEALILSLLAAGWFRRWRGDPRRSEGAPGWWHANRRRALRFGFWGFLQNQSGLLYGSAPNRLVAAHYLPAAEVALFGLADNLINLVRRFMPTQLFIGLIRPVALARFSASGDFKVVAWVTNLAYRLNLLLLVLGIALMVTVGEPLLGALTGGKYAAAAWLVAGMLVLMITEGMRNMTELMAQAVEKNEVLFFSYLIQSASLLLAIPLLPAMGLWSIVLANIAGTVLANVVVIGRLRLAGHAFALNWVSIVTILTYGALSGVIGWWMTRVGLHFVVVASAVAVFYVTLCLWKPPLERDEREMLWTIVRRKRGARARRSHDAQHPLPGPDDQKTI